MLCAITVDVARIAPVAVDMEAHRMAMTVQPPRNCNAKATAYDKREPTEAAQTSGNVPC
jgi:hypothetical protein